MAATVQKFAYPAPPEPPPTFDWRPEKLIADADQLVSGVDAAWDHIASTVTLSEASFDTVIRPLIEIENKAIDKGQEIRLPASVCETPSIKEAAVRAWEPILNADLARRSREDIFKLVQAVVEKEEALDAEAAFYLSQFHKSFLLSGLHIQSLVQRDRFLAVQQRLAVAQAQYFKNLNSDKSGLWFHLDQLDGLSEDFIASHKHEEIDGKATGRVWLTFRRPDQTQVLRSAKQWRTRREMFLGWEARFKSVNRELFEEIILLRDEAARLMGYSHHSSLKANYRMVKEPAVIMANLERVREMVTPQAETELAELRALKAQEALSNESQKDEHPEIFLWDDTYYGRLFKEGKYTLNQREIAEYFPFLHVLGQQMAIFEKLFGMRFQELNLPGEIQCQVWHEDVLLYAVWDSDDEGGGFLGYLYLDLIARENTYEHIGHTFLAPGYERAGGGRRYPISVVVGNFAPPSKSKPTLLEQPETISLFHELGHAMHNLLSRTKYARFHGTKVARDFVEVPSMMLENFFWVASNIRDISLHYSHLSPEYAAIWRTQQAGTAYNEAEITEKSESMPLPPKHLPHDTITKIIESRHALSGIQRLRSMFLAIFDQLIHSPATHTDLEALNFTELWNKTRKEVTRLCGLELEGQGWDWGSGQTHSRNSMGSQDAGVYTYTLSRVYSVDIWATFFEKDPANVVQGRRYRRMVLEKGGSQDEWKTLTDYFGREPNAAAIERLIRTVDG